MKWRQNSSHNSQMERSKLRPPVGFTHFHENIIQLYCQGNPDPDDLRLSELFHQVYLIGGDRLAFPIGEFRTYSNNRKQNYKQQVRPLRTRVFVADDFFPFFAPSELIDYLLSSQSLPSTTSTMSRTSTRRTSRRTEKYDDDDDGDDRGNSVP